MAQNLNVGAMIQSNSETDNQTDNDTIEKYCYNNNPDSCEISYIYPSIQTPTKEYSTWKLNFRKKKIW